MPNPKIQIEITANSTGYTKATEQVRQESRRMANEVRTQATEARHGLHLVTEEVGIHMPRALQGFVVKLPGVREAMSAAFNAVAVLALINVLVEAGRKVAEFIEKNREAAEKNKAAWGQIHDSLATTNDALQVANDKLANSIAKFEHKPQNGLKLAIDEAIQSASVLGNKLNEDIAKISEALKVNQTGFWGSLTGKGRTDDIAQHAAHTQEQMSDVNSERRDRLAGLRKSGASQAEIDKTIQEFDGRLKSVIDADLGWATQQLALARRDNAPGQDMSDRISRLSNYGSGLGDMSEGLQLGIDNRDLTAQNTKDEAASANQKAAEAAARKAKEAATKQAKERGDMVAVMVAGNEDEARESERISEAIGKTFSEQQRQRLEDDKKVREFEKDQARDYIADVHAQIQAQKDLITVAQRKMQESDRMINRRVRSGDMSEGQAYAARRGAILDEGNATVTSLSNQRDLQMSLGKVDEVQRITDQIDEVEREGGQRLLELHEDYADKIQQKWMHALDGVNGQIATWATGGKTNWAGMFRGQASSLTQSGLRTGEKALLNGLGIGGKSDGSKSNPFYVKDADGKAGSSLPGGSATKGMFGGLLGKMNDSNMLSGLMGGKLFGSGSIFGSIGKALGGFALGGDVLESGIYNTGEQGPEQVYLPQGARVVPHTAAGGSATYNIDARGTDAALVAAHTEAAMRQTHAQAVADAGRAMAEHQRRVPQR